MPASDLAIALVNRAVTGLSDPERCLGWNFRPECPNISERWLPFPRSLPIHMRSMNRWSRLEVHYLANPDGHLHFALLSDWVDASTETLPGDDDLLAAAADGIARLNKRHGPAPDGGERFLLFHRNASGMKARASGWDGSASGASCMS